MKIPELALVVLIGPSGAGKSTFARRHFKPTEILSSDWCRGLVSDDENDLAVTRQAFEVLHFIARQRLALGKLTVVDATNVQPEARQPLVALARELHCLPVAMVLALPERLCHERNAARPDRQFGPHVVRQQTQQMRRSLRRLKDEGFRHLFILETQEAVDAATIVRQPLWNDRRQDHGPFDVIGDVHGCFAELRALLGDLGYVVERADEAAEDGGTRWRARHPAGRKAVFLGDLVDRGPSTPDVLHLAMGMVAEGTALCVPGNHDIKLMRKLRGRDVRLTHGLAESLAQLEREPPAFAARAADFLDRLVSHYVLDDGKLVVAHAGLPESMQGRGSGKVRDFALYGETTGETDEYGLPVRYPWAQDYRGGATVVYGHTPIPEPEWLNRTICIDTYYRGQGVPKVVCEEKHMGSRAVVVLCRDEEVARRRFGVMGEGIGICFTRTGRRFFGDAALEAGLLARLRAAFDASDLWSRLETGWACLDCELMPWSAKAQELLRSQYAPVGAAGTAALAAAVERGGDLALGAAPLLDRARARAEAIRLYVAAYRRYCWEVASLDDLKLAPFHLLATEGLVQPALKCRGPEYLRIIYGPEYLAPENLDRLRARGLSAKRGLALRELALGIEALERFVRHEPLRRVHECVFGVLALESEPVDPRL